MWNRALIFLVLVFQLPRSLIAASPIEQCVIYRLTAAVDGVPAPTRVLEVGTEIQFMVTKEQTRTRYVYFESRGKVLKEPVEGRPTFVLKADEVHSGVFLGEKVTDSGSEILFLDAEGGLHIVNRERVEFPDEMPRKPLQKVVEPKRQNGKPHCSPASAFNCIALLAGRGNTSLSRWFKDQGTANGLYQKLMKSMGADYNVQAIFAEGFPRGEGGQRGIDRQQAQRRKTLDDLGVQYKQTDAFDELLGHLDRGPAILDCWVRIHKKDHRPITRDGKTTHRYSIDLTKRNRITDISEKSQTDGGQSATVGPLRAPIEVIRNFITQQNSSSGSHHMLALGKVSSGEYRDYIILMDSHQGTFQLVSPHVLKESLERAHLIYP